MTSESSSAQVNSTASRRVIITGGGGLVGQRVAADLAAHQYEVIILSRNPDQVVGLPAGVEAVGWDAATAEGWGHLADGAAAIINLAGENLSGTSFFPARWTEARRRRIRESRRRAGEAVVAAVEAASQKPGVVIQMSAVGYYGPQGDGLVTEESPPGDDFLALTCVVWEETTAPVVAMGVRRAVMRMGVVLTPEGGALKRLMLPFKLFVGGPMGSGRQWLSWLHPEDATRAIRLLMENPEAHGVYNVTSPQPVTNGQLGRALGRVMRRPYFMPVPGFALRLAFGEVAMVVLEGQRVLPQRLEASGFDFEYPQVETALAQLLD
jgi:uncharacterized protein (TIGR01777 family)